jgi:hypothetical protein
METPMLVAFRTAVFMAKALISGKMAVHIKASFSREKDKVEAFGKELMVMCSRESTSVISKMAGGSSSGKMDKYMKGSSRMM